MKRSTAVIIGVVSLAALLFLAASGRPAHPVATDFYVVSWLASFIALAVSLIMLFEYALHLRRIYLFLWAAFLSAGIMDFWNAVTLRSGGSFTEAKGYAIWTACRVTLSLLALAGLAAYRSTSVRNRRVRDAVFFTVGAVFWSALLVFLAPVLHLGERLQDADLNLVVSTATAILFALGCIGFSRSAVHRSNAVLAWMTYGFVPSVFGQLALGVSGAPSGTYLGYAEATKVFSYLAPFAGLLAEHLRLQRRLHKQNNELHGLIQVQQAASSTSDPTEAFRRIVDAVAASFDAAAVCLMPYNRSRNLMEVAAHVGLDAETAKALVLRPGEGLFGAALSGRKTAFIPDIREDTSLADKMSGSGVRAAICVPLLSRGESAGILVLFFRHSERMSKEQLRILEAFARQAEITLENTEIRGYAREYSRTSESRARELEAVWEIGQAITSKLELNDLVDTLVEQLKIGLEAQACSLVLLDSESGNLRIMGHKRLTRYHPVEHHVDRCDAIAVMVAKEGRPRSVANVPNSALCKYPELAKDDQGTHHMISVPMIAQGRSVGAINVFRSDGEPFGEAELRLLSMLGTVAGVGIANARAYERQKRIAEGLQAVLTPNLQQKTPPGTIVYTYYRAGMDDEGEIGGDFYDIIDLGDGKYGIAIGDVCGKGLDAAVYTGMARYMLQAYSAEDHDPSSVVARANNALCRYTPANKFVTLFFGILDTRDWTFTYVNAGHELPFLRKADGAITKLDTTGPAVGAILEADYSSETIKLGDGDALVMYTDGATEARYEGKFLGTDGLERIVAADFRKDIEDPAHAIFHDVYNHARGFLRDDVAIMILKVSPPPAGKLF